MKTLKALRLSSTLAVLIYIAWRTFKTGMDAAIITATVIFTVLVVISYIGNIRREKNPARLSEYTKGLVNFNIALAVFFIVGALIVLAINPSDINSIAYLLVAVYLIANTLIQYKTRQKYLEENPE